MGDKGRLAVVQISSVAHSKRMIDREMQTVGVGIHWAVLALRYFGKMKILTVVRDQAPSILNVKIGECAVDMRANLLPCLSRPKDPDDGYLRRIFLLCLSSFSWYLRVELGWGALVVVDAVKSNAEDVHVSS